jgi:hypothetical protein
MRPWEVQAEKEAAAQKAMNHGILCDAVAGMRHQMTAADKAEADRLMALPYGSEGNALRRLAMRLADAKRVAA